MARTLIQAAPDLNGVARLPRPRRTMHRQAATRRRLNAVNEHLSSYVGSSSHRARMARLGLTRNEIDPALVRRA